MPIENAAVSGGIESYIRLVWLFTIFITVLMLLLCYLYMSVRKAREQEQLSREFSYLMIEGLETERMRISRELHDTVLPLVREGRGSNEMQLSDLIRSICINLMPPDFTRLSLKDLLALLCAQFSKRSKIECACSIEENMDFSQINAENKLHIYRMIQEALNNIEKHSKASRAALSIRWDLTGPSEKILICVCDEGVGIQNLSAAYEGLGMRSIRQRAAIIGAAVKFISETGNGLMVRIELIIPAIIREQQNG
ncbi:MAG: histidine kinase [Treponema sp.]|nr:histidine kinase [Treponema sp.]